VDRRFTLLLLLIPRAVATPREMSAKARERQDACQKFFASFLGKFSRDLVLPKLRRTDLLAGMNAAPGSSRTLLFVWAGVATLCAIFFASLACFFFVQLREQSRFASTPTNTTVKLQPDRIELSEDYSASNIVSVTLGRTEVDGGITHLPDWPDGWTRVDELDGIPCRYMNHRAHNLAGGAYLYFAVHPSLKNGALKSARVEVEYFVRNPTRLKLQYDGIEEGQPRPYKPAPEILAISPSNGWQTAVFRLTEPAFMNSQNGRADFRLDASPPEIYVRRVTMIREGGARSP
jgi:hypothetical protein